MWLLIIELAGNRSAENLSWRPTGAPGRLLGIDLGSRRIGVAVCDELRISVRPVTVIERRSWKDLLRRISELVKSYEARALIVGLPLNLDGTEGPAANNARGIVEKFRLSLGIPVYLQDERLTTFEAKSVMIQEGRGERERRDKVDSEAAAVILRDFIASNAERDKLNHR